jgi:hypothetical protein
MLECADGTLYTGIARDLDRRLQQALSVIEPLASRLNRGGLGSEARYLAGCAHLRAGDLGEARLAFAGIWAAHPLAERASVILRRLSDGERLPEKSTVAAGLLSIVPGLGHVYLEQYSVGLTALAWNGLFGYAAFEAFRHRRWGVGALLAAMELLWYSGTIYGAVSGAERYNRDAVLNYLDELDQAAGLDVAVPDDRWVTEIVFGGRF